MLKKNQMTMTISIQKMGMVKIDTAPILLYVYQTIHSFF